jgi:hypothetical protein
MADWLGHFTHIVSVIADSKAIFGAGGLALLSVTGAVPRLGFGRAITFGWRSYFRTTHPLSVRKAEVERLSESLRDIKQGSYITITGGKGNGKSCLIDTTLNRHVGVVKISVSLCMYTCVHMLFFSPVHFSQYLSSFFLHKLYLIVDKIRR